MRLALVWAFAAVGGFGQMPERSRDGYIESVFERQIGQLPRMGWFAPEYGFLARESEAAEIVVLGPLGTGAVGSLQKRVLGRPLPRRAEYGIACELSGSDLLSVYRVEGETRPRRALYLSRRMAGEVRRGLVLLGLERDTLAKVNRLLRWPETGELRRDSAYGVSDGTFFYSRHRLYDAKSSLLREEAIVLHGARGEIVAHAVHRMLDAEPPCDGCAIPRYSRAEAGVYQLLQMFVLPQFAYPVLLLDTSTFEHEALTLLTVTPAGKVTEFRVSEYVMHCD